MDEPASPLPAAPRSFLPQDADLARLQLYARAKAPRQAVAVPSDQPAERPDGKTMIERLAARLEAKPGDADGWRMLGWSYFNLQQPMKAVEAYARAVALQPQLAQLRSAYGEAMVAAESGNVTPQAVTEFNAALALDGGDLKARYFLALAMQQSSKKKEAFETWRTLQAAQPWVADLRQRTQSLARELNVDWPAPAAAASPPTGPVTRVP
jgi:cytochrome c-type biogenesis protein CcmH